MPYNIKIDREKCIGCGACAAQCDNFEVKDDGKAYAKKSGIKEMGCNQEAAGACPVNAISITKK